MKKIGFYVALLISLAMVSSLVLATAQADDVGCECMICFTSPQGPDQFVECHKPVAECERRLARGERLTCEKTKSEGIDFKEGVQEYLTCEQSYGEGYELHEFSAFDEGGCNGTFGNHGVGCMECRKVVGFKEEEVCVQGEAQESCETVLREIYDVKPIERNPEPNYIEVMQDGQKLGETHYYKLNRR